MLEIRLTGGKRYRLSIGCNEHYYDWIDEKLAGLDLFNPDNLNVSARCDKHKRHKLLSDVLIR